MNFGPRGGAFDLSPHNLYREVRMAAKKDLVSWQSQQEAEWLPSLEEGKNYTEILSKFSDVFRGEEVASSLFL